MAYALCHVKSIHHRALPKPNNPAVTLCEVPASNYAVICFSGFASKHKITKKTADLLAWLNCNGITTVGKPELASYNPPWKLPFFAVTRLRCSIKP